MKRPFFASQCCPSIGSSADGRWTPMESCAPAPRAAQVTATETQRSQRSQFRLGEASLKETPTEMAHLVKVGSELWWPLLRQLFEDSISVTVSWRVVTFDLICFGNSKTLSYNSFQLEFFRKKHIFAASPDVQAWFSDILSRNTRTIDLDKAYHSFVHIPSRRESWHWQEAVSSLTVFAEKSVQPWLCGNCDSGCEVDDHDDDMIVFWWWFGYVMAAAVVMIRNDCDWWFT